MRLIGNILWFVFGGCVQGLLWVLWGVLWSITIIGIPARLQCFPFGKEVITTSDSSASLILNILWFIFGGFGMAITNLITAIILAITIVGIPFSKQSLKLAKLSFTKTEAAEFTDQLGKIIEMVELLEEVDYKVIISILV